MALVQTDDLFRAKRGVAVLVACIAQTLNESDPTFEERFVKKLDAAYSEVREHSSAELPGDPIHEMELISWVRELLTGWCLSTGQGKKFLER
jgi:hypothetical protein